MAWDSVVIHPREGRALLRVDASALVAAGVCDEKNSHYAMTCIATYISLLDDSPLGKSTKPAYLYRKWLRALSARPLLDTIRQLALLADRLMTGAVLMGVSDAEWFTTPEGITWSPGPFIDEMLDSPVAKEYITYWQDGNLECFGYVLNFLRFAKKMKYVEEAFYDTALTKWEAVEDRLQSLQFDSADPTIRLIRSFAHHYLGLTPKVGFADLTVGPGHVAERLDAHTAAHKVSAMQFKHPVSRVVRAGTIRSASPVVTSEDELERLLSGVGDLKLVGRLSEDPSTARMKFVPKDVSTARTICMEPSGNMLVQQAVWRSMRRRMRKTMASITAFEDQGVNRDLARWGSESSLVDTIDLSSASDSVHINLVRAIMPRPWLYWFLGTRSALVQLPDNSIRSVAKFAPMGSALCFPVQCVVFASIVAAAHVVYATRTLGLDTDEALAWVEANPGRFLAEHISSEATTKGLYGRKCRFTPFAVYGDDIICDSRVTEDVLLLLDTLGFIPNREKSFKGVQAFRESCGGFYLAGHDVTPVTFKVDWFKRDIPPSTYLGMLELANVCYDRGLLNTRSQIIRQLRHWIAWGLVGERLFELPYVSSRDAVGIFTPQVKDYALNNATQVPVRWNSKLQRFEYRTVLLKTVEAKFNGDLADANERYAYHIAGRGGGASEANELSRAHSRHRVDGLRYSWRWIPSCA